MTTSDPGERKPGEVRDSRGDRAGRRLEQAPSGRYASPDRADDAQGSITGPVAQAAVVAVAGAVLLFLVGAVVASTVGLAFVCGVMGAGIGLLLARLGVARDGAPPRLSRSSILWLAIGLAIGAVVAADVATWLYAVREGGTLGLLDYLFETFGPFVPGELIVAALGAMWGASSGPVMRS